MRLIIAYRPRLVVKIVGAGVYECSVDGASCMGTCRVVEYRRGRDWMENQITG